MHNLNQHSLGRGQIKSNQIGPKLFPNYGVLKAGVRLMSVQVCVGGGVGGFLLSVYCLFYCEHNIKYITKGLFACIIMLFFSPMYTEKKIIIKKF